MNVLYLDDNDEVIRLAVNKLEKRKHVVYPVKSMEEAAEVLADKTVKIDLFIADPHLHDENHVDLLMGLKITYEKVDFCVVSHTVPRGEVNQLKMANIQFFEKPILIDKVVESFVKVPPGVNLKKKANSRLSLR